MKSNFFKKTMIVHSQEKTSRKQYTEKTKGMLPYFVVVVVVSHLQKGLTHILTQSFLALATE